MLKVVLTGGPCAGKTSVLDRLMRVYRNRAVRVGEAASILLDGGFPVRRGSPGWLIAFQRAVSATQVSLEAIAQAEAAAEGMDLVLLDRGLVDGAAYVGGLEELALLVGMRARSMLAWYDVVIHLRSLATTKPESYSQEGNRNRAESLVEAVAVERELERVWSGHRHRAVVGYYASIDEKAAAVVQVIDDELARVARAA